MITISDNTKAIKHSKIRDMFNRSLKYDNVISFAIGEPDFTASEEVVLAGCNAIIEGKSKYSENAGIMPLRMTISNYLYNEIGVEYDPISEITVTTGAMCGIYQVLKVMLNPGDEVIVIEPYWTNYIQQIIMCNGVPISIPADTINGLQPDIKKIRSSVTNRTKAIIINSPCNPTGIVFSNEIIKSIAEIAKEKDIFIISDEVYKHIIFDNLQYKSIASFEDMKKRTLVVDSFSKTYAMTGWRVGYVAGPQQIISNITKLQENITACVSMPSQYAAMAALNGTRNHLNMMISCYKERRDYISKRLESMPGVSYKKSSGTFYAFISIKGTGLSSEEFSIRLLEEKQVVVVPGTAFGNSGEGYIRISFATSMENIQKGMDLMEEFIRGIKHVNKH